MTLSLPTNNLPLMIYLDQTACYPEEDMVRVSGRCTINIPGATYSESPKAIYFFLAATYLHTLYWEQIKTALADFPNVIIKETKIYTERKTDGGVSDAKKHEEHR